MFKWMKDMLTWSEDMNERLTELDDMDDIHSDWIEEQKFSTIVENMVRDGLFESKDVVEECQEAKRNWRGVFYPPRTKNQRLRGVE